MAKLHGIALAEKDVARVERLDFGGGNEIYILDGAERGCEHRWRGRHVLPPLARGNRRTHKARPPRPRWSRLPKRALDLAPLAGHPALASLRLSGACSNASALESVKTLRQLDVSLGSVDDARVLDRLAARGVTIIGRSD